MFFLLRKLMCLIYGVTDKELMKAEIAVQKNTRHRRHKKYNRFR